MVVKDRLPLWGPLASVAVLGFAVGAAQSVILRRFGPSPATWILVTGAAFGVAWFVMLGIAAVVEAWVPANILAWTLCGAIVWIAPSPLRALTEPVDRLLTWIAGHPNSSSMGKFLVGGLLAGAITGAALPIMFSVPPASVARAQAREP